MDPLLDKFLGGLVGLAAGDAVGELAFRYTRRSELTEAIRASNTLVYTDDTAMALGLAEALVERGEVDPDHLGEIFRRNFEAEPWRGYASGPPTVFSLVRSGGMSYAEAAGSLFGGDGSFGNGAAMRVAPVGLFFRRNEELYRQAEASAVVTHNHPVGIDGAAVQALTVAAATECKAEEELKTRKLAEELREFAGTREIREKMSLVERALDQGTEPGRTAAGVGRSVAVHESMPFAVFSFLKHPDSFEECLWCAVTNGGDRDTLGAMACSASGARLGLGGIPEKLRSKVENLPRIEELARKLYERAVVER
jgi:poly(ADP-ribose) glycohydrolase ARH3